MVVGCSSFTLRRGGVSFVVVRRSLWWCVVRYGGASSVVVRRVMGRGGASPVVSVVVRCSSRPSSSDVVSHRDVAAGLPIGEG
jgi:hypothetical protein